jgi:hypothetical protein
MHGRCVLAVSIVIFCSRSTLILQPVIAAWGGLPASNSDCDSGIDRITVERRFCRRHAQQLMVVAATGGLLGCGSFLPCSWVFTGRFDGLCSMPFSQQPVFSRMRRTVRGRQCHSRGQPAEVAIRSLLLAGDMTALRDVKKACAD